MTPSINIFTYKIAFLLELSLKGGFWIQTLSANAPLRWRMPRRLSVTWHQRSQGGICMYTRLSATFPHPSNISVISDSATTYTTALYWFIFMIMVWLIIWLFLILEHWILITDGSGTFCSMFHVPGCRANREYNKNKSHKSCTF